MMHVSDLDYHGFDMTVRWYKGPHKTASISLALQPVASEGDGILYFVVNFLLKGPCEVIAELAESGPSGCPGLHPDVEMKDL